MRYGAFHFVRPGGIEIPSGLLEPLGITEGCTCWGVWTRPLRGRGALHTDIENEEFDLCGADRPRDPEDEDGDIPMESSSGLDPTLRSPHLVISPIPPPLWLASFKISLMLDDTPGALADALQVLARHCNLLDAQTCTSDGAIAPFSAIAHFTHPSLSQVVDSSALKQLLKSLRERRSTIEQRKIAYARLGRLLNGAMSLLVADLLLRDSLGYADSKTESGQFDPVCPILSPWITSNGNSPWHLTLAEIRQTTEVLNDLLPEGLDDSSQETQGLRMIPHREWAEEIFEELGELLSSEINPYTKHHQDGSSDEPPAIYLSRLRNSFLAPKDRAESTRRGALLAWRESQFERVWHENWNRAITTKALTTLAHAMLWSYPDLDPLPLLYEDGKLRVMNTDEQTAEEMPSTGIDRIISELVTLTSEESYNDCPICLTAYDQESSYLRLRFFRRQYCEERTTLVVITYHAYFSTPNRSIQYPLHGLVAHLSRCAKEHGANIERLHNETTSRQHSKGTNTSSERGVIYIYLRLDDNTPTDPNKSSISDRRHWKAIFEEALIEYSAHLNPHVKFADTPSTFVECKPWPLDPGAPE